MKAAAALYGVDMVTDAPDSPHLEVPHVKGELYFGFAEHDPGVEPHVVPTLKSALDNTGRRHVLETVAGTHHGFMFAIRPDFNPVAAEATWDKLFALWDRNLK